MRKNKGLFALLAGILAAALFAVPASAMAQTVDDDGTVHLTQADFHPENEGSFYAICDSRSYVLDEDVTGRIRFTSDGNVKPTLDLNGHELTGVGDSTVWFDTGQMGTVTIKNGTLSQSTNKHVVYVDAGVFTVNFDSVNISATDAICVQVESSSAVNINGGTYTTTNTTGGAGEPVLCAGGAWGRINVQAGDFQLVGGTTIVKRDNDAVTNYIKVAPASDSSNITFSSFPSQAELASGYTLLKSKGGSYEVVASGSDKLAEADWMVSGVTNFGTVYFEDGDEAKAFAAEDAARTATQLRATVTFDPANGDEPASYKVNIGGYATDLVSDPGKADGVFKFWSADKQTEFELATTPITEDITLTALYDDAVATNGSVGYASLQDAINANYDEGATVTLLADTTESVTVPADTNLTIDLGGKTLTGIDGKEAIWVKGKATLTITNGTVRSNDDCLYVGPEAAGSTINLASEGELSKGALYFSRTQSQEPEGGNVYVVSLAGQMTTLNINGGNYESAGSYSVRVDDAILNVTDGQFSNGEDDDDSSTILATYSSRVEFAGERVSGHIGLETGSTATVYSGKFGDATNAGDVVEGKYLFKGNDPTDDCYEVIDLDDALEYSDYVVYDYDKGTKVYFQSFDDAQNYADALFEEGDEVAIVKLYRVYFLVSKGDGFEQYDVRVCEDGTEIGELPDSSQLKVEGYTFAGWYVNGKKIDASYKVTADAEAYAMWYKDGSTEPTDDPSGKDASKDDSKGDKKLPQTGDPVLAVSGIAAAGAALAGFGALRRRK